MKKISVAVVIFLGLMLLPILPANADFIDLNDFFADPTVTVAVDGFSALMEEDLSLFSVLLSNDPGVGDPEVIKPGPGMEFLKFEYSFTEAPDNDDEFLAFVFDPLDFSVLFDFFTGDTSVGSITFDLSSFSGQTLGLQFQLTSFDTAVGSVATVSNVRLAPIPEPATLLLVGTGLFGLLGLGRRKFQTMGK